MLADGNVTNSTVLQRRKAVCRLGGGRGKLPEPDPRWVTKPRPLRAYYLT